MNLEAIATDTTHTATRAGEAKNTMKAHLSDVPRASCSADRAKAYAKAAKAFSQVALWSAIAAGFLLEAKSMLADASAHNATDKQLYYMRLDVLQSSRAADLAADHVITALDAFHEATTKEN